MFTNERAGFAATLAFTAAVTTGCGSQIKLGEPDSVAGAEPPIIEETIPSYQRLYAAPKPGSYRAKIMNFFDTLPAHNDRERTAINLSRNFLLDSIDVIYEEYVIDLPEDSLEKAAYNSLLSLKPDAGVNDAKDYAYIALTHASQSLDPYTYFLLEPVEEKHAEKSEPEEPAEEVSEPISGSLLSSYPIENVVGYVKLTEFFNHSDITVETGIQIVNEWLKDDGVGWILDLRNNPGGFVDEARKIADLFLDQGIIYDTIHRGQVDKSFRAERGDLLKGKPLIVLINSQSGSASEIVAGALQENHRALIIGDLSFGKGIIQTHLPIENTAPSAEQHEIQITSHFYLVGNSRYPVQHRGIIPNVLAHNKNDQQVLYRLD